MMKPTLINLSSIECLQVEAPSKDVGVVFFHGYGANMHDLFPLWEMWHQDEINWYFPNGIEPLPMGYYEGRAWFQIDVAALERAIQEGTHRDMAATIPPSFDLNLKRMEFFLRELASRHKKLIIGGFSQGAMCASHLAMIKDLPIEGLVLLSGNMIAESKLPPESRGIPFYQSHGTRDPILPLSGAKLLEQKLTSLNFTGKLDIFEGGHEIPMQVIQGVKQFLQSVI
jgi:phospholipase/carboxylesterase